MSSKNIQHGVVAGLAGGSVFGIMMGMMGTLPTIGQMAGFPNALAGLVVHLMVSAFIGATFAVLFQAFITSMGAGIGYGAAYGALWWLLGPLTLMPLMLGMGLGANWSGEAAIQMLPSLSGHLIFGLILGGTYARIKRRSHTLPSWLRPAAGRA
jgi:hypothetical protein